ncbi:MAG: hypothetical protein ABI229_02950 [Gemmatimonadaceae bacterium]
MPPIDRSASSASVPFGAGVIALGLLTFVYSAPVEGLEPVPRFIAAIFPFAYIAGALLIASGAAIAAGIARHTAAITIAVVLFIWLLLHTVILAPQPLNGGLWVSAFETFALFGAACVAVGTTASIDIGAPSSAAMQVAIVVGRMCFGVSLLAFGGSHFLYSAYVASVIPSWLPYPYFWTYAVALAHLAAGVAILTRIKARLAATLLAIMFGSWVIILHGPRVAHNPGSHDEWTSLVVAFAMCGASWVIASSFSGDRDVVGEREVRR